MLVITLAHSFLMGTSLHNVHVYLGLKKATSAAAVIYRLVVLFIDNHLLTHINSAELKLHVSA